MGIYAFGLNIAGTLNPFSDDDFIEIPVVGASAGEAGGLVDISSQLGCDDILWTGWGATVGYDSCSDQVKIWGTHPSPQFTGTLRTLPTILPLPAVKIKRFIGRETLEAALGEDGVVYVPSVTASDEWEALNVTRWEDVAMMGNGLVIAIHSSCCDPVTATSLQKLSLPSSSANTGPRPLQKHFRIFPGSSHAILSASSAFEPPSHIGSALHSQSSSYSAPSYSAHNVFTPISFLSGVPGLISLSVAGTYSAALTKEGGQGCVWGGAFGCIDDWINVCGSEEEEEDLEISILEVGATGSAFVVLVDADGDGQESVWISGMDTLKPSMEPHLPEPVLEKAPNFQRWDGLLGKKIKKAVPASGGRGWFIITE